MEHYIVKSSRFVLLLFIPLFFFSSCAEPKYKKVKLHKPLKTSFDKPLWLTSPQTLTSFQAVGYSPPNFQGMHIQRTQAITQAREALAQKISIYMESNYKNLLQENKGAVKKQYMSNIISKSKILLDGSYQADAYIDEKGNLYVLMQMKGIEPKLPLLKTEKFSIEPLLKRRCYTKKTLLKIKTKAPIYKGKPVWFYRPNDGVSSHAAIGIAERKQSSTFQSQKNTAIILAKLALTQRDHIALNSYNKISKVVVHDELGLIDEWHTKTKVLSKGSQVKLLDLWMDPKQCELYVWVEEK